MRKSILLLIVLLMTVMSAVAQVAINQDHSPANSAAILDIKSTVKGVLIPRMTRTEIEAVSSPANGLMVYNTTDGKFYIYSTAKSIWRQVDYGAGEITTPASYTIGSGGSCNNTTVYGDYIEGSALNSGDTVILDANVTVAGDWSISTNTTNGYSFSGGGIFAGTGTQQVKLTGSGMPTAASQSDGFTATASNGNGTCTFTVKVIGTVIGANGRIWMDRNLGASEVATSSTDAAAYGDLYQWGRAADGHEKRSSPTYDGDNNTLATTSVPNLGNAWDGKFIQNNTAPDDWLQTQDGTLWTGLNASNNPCPEGFRLATTSEWTDELNTWSSKDAAGAFNSPLKLTVAGYRDYQDGSIILKDNNNNPYAWYWAANPIGQNASELGFRNNSASMQNDPRGYGQSVRCIKD